jgi:hypothetical protein
LLKTGINVCSMKVIEWYRLILENQSKAPRPMVREVKILTEFHGMATALPAFPAFPNAQAGRKFGTGVVGFLMCMSESVGDIRGASFRILLSRRNESSLGHIRHQGKGSPIAAQDSTSL